MPAVAAEWLLATLFGCVELTGLEVFSVCCIVRTLEETQEMDVFSPYPPDHGEIDQGQDGCALGGLDQFENLFGQIIHGEAHRGRGVERAVGIEVHDGDRVAVRRIGSLQWNVRFLTPVEVEPVNLCRGLEHGKFRVDPVG